MPKLNIKGFLQVLLDKLSSSFKRFPVPLSMAIASVVLLIMQNHDMLLQYISRDTYQRLAMVAAMGIPLFLSISVFFERLGNSRGKRLKLGIEATALALLALYYLFLLKDMAMVPVTRYVAISIALYFTFAFMPYVFSRGHFEKYVLKLITSFFITYLYAVILFLGLAAILLTIDLLFSININYRLYLDIWLIVAGIFAPAYFLSALPTHNHSVAEEEYSKVFKVLLLYIVMPLLVVYTIILYVYFGKIIITGEWPQIMISNLVLWYGLISSFVVFLAYPLRDSNKWAKTFTSQLPRIILPLLIMMFIALGIRLNAYGITERRYFVLMAGLLVFGNMLYLGIKRNPKTIVLFISITAVFVISVAAPINAYSVSRYSQNKRFEKLLIDNQMLVNGNIAPAKDQLSEDVKKEISSIVLYFENNHSIDKLRYVPKDINLKDLGEQLGFDVRDYYYWHSPKTYYSYSLENRGDLIEIGDYDYFVDYIFYAYRKDIHQSSGIGVAYDEKTQSFNISLEGQLIYSKNLEEIALSIKSKGGNEYNQSRENMTYIDENQQVEVKFIVKHISLSENKDNKKITLDSMEFYCFVKVK